MSALGLSAPGYLADSHPQGTVKIYQMGGAEIICPSGYGWPLGILATSSPT